MQARKANIFFNIACFVSAVLFCLIAQNDFSMFLATITICLWPLSIPIVIGAVWFLVKAPPWRIRQKYLAALLGLIAGCSVVAYLHRQEWPYLLRAWQD